METHRLLRARVCWCGGLLWEGLLFTPRLAHRSLGCALSSLLPSELHVSEFACSEAGAELSCLTLLLMRGSPASSYPTGPASPSSAVFASAQASCPSSSPPSLHTAPVLLPDASPRLFLLRVHISHALSGFGRGCTKDSDPTAGIADFGRERLMIPALVTALDVFLWGCKI